MLNYTENTHPSTTVPPSSVLCTQNQEDLRVHETVLKEILPVPGTLTFRKATIESESIYDLKLGIIYGQDSYVDLSYDNVSITSHDLAYLFAETMNSGEPEAYNVGFVIGVVDALLRARKTYPREWW